ncbi:MAG TPA: hypothetical protein VJG90_00820 [Candidatus Nanoarchaeia archaeon]|nr:hypothetical protein [Candidatus Nanoarchaeia archaeon]
MKPLPLTAAIGLHEPGVKQITKMHLQYAGYTVREFDTIESFLNHCGEGEPHELYFLDTNLETEQRKLQPDGQSIHQAHGVLQRRGLLVATTNRESSRLIGTTGHINEAQAAIQLGFEVVMKPHNLADLVGRYVRFCRSEESEKLIIPPRCFDHFTPADFKARLEARYSGERRLDESQLCTAYKKAVTSWSLGDSAAFFQLFDDHLRHTRITWPTLHLPNRIPLVRCKDLVEGGLAYTIQGAEVYTDNRVVVMTANPGTKAYYCDHELAHVLSRENSALMEALRERLGYTGPHPVDFNHPIFDERMLNNPDVTRHYATHILMGAERVRVLPIVMLQKGYTSQSLAAAFNAHELQDMFLVVEEHGEELKPVLTGGDPTFIPFGQANGFAERYGGVISPEFPVIHFDEVWADLFAAVRRDLYGTERSEGIPRCDEGFLRGIDDLLRAT